MTRRIVLLALFATGCLSTGKAPYGKLDDQPPTVVSIVPAMGGDAGVPTINGGSFISITFSEQLDVDSIRPGIVVHAIGLFVFFALVWPHDKERTLMGEIGRASCRERV